MAAGQQGPTLRCTRLLNLFLPLKYILPKELNALRLDDALLSGSWSGKKRFLTQSGNASLMGPPTLLPSHCLPPELHKSTNKKRWQKMSAFFCAVMWLCDSQREGVAISGALSPCVKNRFFAIPSLPKSVVQAARVQLFGKA